MGVTAVRPSESAIRAELRREAAKVSVPDEMWTKISERLDGEMARADKRKRLWHQLINWRPAFALAVAAGVFWMALIPVLPPARPDATNNAASVSASSNTEQGEITTLKRYRREQAREHAAKAAEAADQPMTNFTYQSMMAPR